MKLTLSGICKSYRNKVLDGISLTAEEGECIALLGSNGSGKSTLLSILAGVVKPDSGSFNYGGRELFSDKKYLSKAVGYVPQNNPLIEELTSYDNLRLWYSARELEASLSEGVLSLLEIKDFLKTPVCELSGGMKKRLSIAVSLSSSPEILLLDEPSAVLDAVCKKKIFDYYKYFMENHGIIITATHDVSEISECTKCFILKNGILVPFAFKTMEQLAEAL